MWAKKRDGTFGNQFKRLVTYECQFKKSSSSDLEVDSEHDQGERLMREQLGMGDNLESGIEIKSVSGISGESNLRGGANMEYESESLT